MPPVIQGTIYVFAAFGFLALIFGIAVLIKGDQVPRGYHNCVNCDGLGLIEEEEHD